MLHNTKSVKITDLNTNNQTRYASLTYNGDINNVTNVYVNKFTICKKMPVYIPTLIVDDESINVPGYSKQSIDINYSQLPYRMNLSVLIKDTTNKKYAMSNVRYESNRVVNKPFPFNMSDAALSKSTVLNNEYFYMYSTLELTRMITTCIKKCLDACNVAYTPKDIYIGMLESGFYQLMLKESIASHVDIYFNYDLQNLFPFDFENSLALNDSFQKIVFEPMSSMDFNGVDYLIAQSLYKSTRMYPFRNIIFSSNTLAMEKILNSNNLSKSIYNDSVVELLSFSLNIDSPDQANDCFEFQLTSLYNALILHQNSVSNLSIDVYLQTVEGYNVRLLLKKDEFIQTTLNFITE